MTHLDLACSILLFAATIAAAVLYAVRVRRLGPAHHARIERAGSSALLGRSPLEMGYWALGPVARACVAARVGADAVSWTSLVLAAFAGVSLALGHFGIGALASVGSFLCDAIDGMVARETGTASRAGEVLDATMDRYAELLFFGGLLVHARADVGAMTVTIGALSGAVMVSYSTAKAEALGVEAPRGVMRRQERAVYLAAGTACVPVAAALAARLGWPEWTGTLPLVLCLGLVAVVGNASAVCRLRSVARAVRQEDGVVRPRPHASCPTRGARAATSGAPR